MKIYMYIFFHSPSFKSLHFMKLWNLYQNIYFGNAYTNVSLRTLNNIFFLKFA